MFPWLSAIFVASVGYATYFWRSRSVAHEIDVKVAAKLTEVERAKDAEVAAFAVATSTADEITELIKGKMAHGRVSKGIRPLAPEVSAPVNKSPAIRVRFIDGKTTRRSRRYVSVLSFVVWVSLDDKRMTPTVSMSGSGSPVALSTPLTTEQKALIWAEASQVVADYLVKQRLKATVQSPPPRRRALARAVRR
jgi:hypothetical protein